MVKTVSPTTHKILDDFVAGMSYIDLALKYHKNTRAIRTLIQSARVRGDPRAMLVKDRDGQEKQDSARWD